MSEILAAGPRRAKIADMMTEERSAELQYLISLELENIRSFQHLKLDFGTAHKPRMLTVIVGRNGTCKTTVLRALALGLVEELAAPSLLKSISGQWTSEGRTSSSVVLNLADNSGQRVVRLDQDRVPWKSGWLQPDVFACGYGLGRNTSQGEQGAGYRTIDSVATLFRYDAALVQAELVLRRLRDYLSSSRFDETLDRLKAALSLPDSAKFELPAGGGLTISGPGIGRRIPLEAWADGYRMTFSWLIDFFGWAMRNNAFDAEGEIKGILLVDEIEQHMHPSMQAGILAHLRKALPKVQLIVTTHSPLVALAAMPEEIVALHREGDRVVRREVPNLTGYSYEDALVEKSLFGVDPFAPTTRHKLDQLHQLQRSPPLMRSADVNEELRSLAVDLSLGRPTSLRADPVLEELAEIKNLLKARAAGK